MIYVLLYVECVIRVANQILLFCILRLISFVFVSVVRIMYVATVYIDDISRYQMAYLIGAWGNVGVVYKLLGD